MPTASLPRSMTAAILVASNTPLVIDEIELPTELGIGQVLVRMLYSGICGSQIGEIQAVKGPDKYLPHLLGHEGVATVEGIGPGVTKVKVGDKVVLHWKKGVGVDAAPPRYSWQGRHLNAGQITTFSSYSIIAENRMTRLDQDLPLEGAALLGCAVLTGLGVVCNDAAVKIGESVVVLGAGGIGLNAIEGAKLSGAFPIVGVDRYEEKLALATSFGASHVVHSTVCADLLSTLRSILPEKHADVVIECTGAVNLIELAYELSGPKGRVVLVGVPRAGQNISIYSLPLHFGKRLVGSEGGDANPSLDIPRYARLAAHGRIQLQQLVTDVYEFRDIQKAIDAMIAGSIRGRCVVRFSDAI
ncbi:MAG: dehydrogenase [Proteobacteria bacterium]|nr:dehydrogenase [Pseudomonadota bacterium]